MMRRLTTLLLASCLPLAAIAQDDASDATRTAQAEIAKRLPLDDPRDEANVLRGKKVHPYVRALVIPGTNDIYRQAMKEGLVDIFLEAGAAVTTPTCGPCFGGHTGLLASGEKAVATSNRNFKGRMGPGGDIYLAGPAVAAASAVKGRIAHPGEVL